MALLETLFYSIHFKLTFLIPRLIVLGGYVRFPTYVWGSCKLRLGPIHERCFTGFWIRIMLPVLKGIIKIKRNTGGGLLKYIWHFSRQQALKGSLNCCQMWIPFFLLKGYEKYRIMRNNSEILKLKLFHTLCDTSSDLIRV